MEPIARDQVKCGTTCRGRVVETCLQRDVPIVKTVCVEGNYAARRWPAKEIHQSALAYHGDRLIPSRRRRYCFHDDICPSTFWSQRADLFDDIPAGPSRNDLGCTEKSRRCDLLFSFDHSHHAHAFKVSQMNKHQSDGPGADNHHRVSGPDLRFTETMHNAGERFSQRSMLEGEFFRNKERVLLDDARRDSEVLSVGPVVEEQIVTEILLPA